MGDLLADGGRVRDDHRLGDLLLMMLVVGLGVFTQSLVAPLIGAVVASWSCPRTGFEVLTLL